MGRSSSFISRFSDSLRLASLFFAYLETYYLTYFYTTCTLFPPTVIFKPRSSGLSSFFNFSGCSTFFFTDIALTSLYAFYSSFLFNFLISADAFYIST